jgi:hypothetical protein
VLATAAEIIATAPLAFVIGVIVGLLLSTRWRLEHRDRFGRFERRTDHTGEDDLDDLL